jgi:hypothetical protein
MGPLDDPALGQHDEASEGLLPSDCCGSRRVPIERLPGLRTTSTWMPWICRAPRAH